MQLTTLLSILPLLSLAHGGPIFPLPNLNQDILSAFLPDESTTRIPTVHESAILARRILSLTRHGTFSTVFPSGDDPNRPADVASLPIGLPDYIADCEGTGNPTILGMPIGTSFKNANAGSNFTLSLAWLPPHHEPFSRVALPRFALIGYLEDIPSSQNVKPCYLLAHPDARAWTPGNPIHESLWMRLVVREIYWIGGFGNMAYIGWIPLEEWTGVRAKEIEEARLPFEEEA
ncbi:MAG: hypothetical protein M1834_009283 [Cirrosporium novae-zelandiae]|nr:MAG: hypothetical protein M1834_009283 [Cirrosporium novae-zelandiae]